MNKTLNFCVILGHLLVSLPAMAQIVPDTTLPARASITRQGTTSIITGGTRAGSNFFHSFEQFSVPTGGTAYFNNALNIQNIISRVTGSSVSNIDGLIRANGTANLFLLNSNGIIFGPNARLNIGGSFMGSTASSLNFADGTSFSAKNPESTPLLTISVPIGLGFGSNPGSIRVQGTGYNLTLTNPIYSPYLIGISSTGLQVKPGKTLAIIGGDVSLNGSVLTAPGGRVELGSVSDGSLSINPTTSGGWNLGYQGLQNFKDIQASQQALINASGFGGGSIQVQGAKVKLADGSLALIQNQGARTSGDINVNASESLELIGTSPNGTVSSGLVNETVRGNGGNIGISTKKLILQGGATILTRTYGAGQGGNLNINAPEFTQLLGASSNSLQIPSNIVTATFGSGDGGSLTLATGSLTIQGGAEIDSASYNAGKGGNLTVNAPEFTHLFGSLSGTFQFPSSISTIKYGLGHGGDVTLLTGTLIVRDGATVSSVNSGSNVGGNVTVNANSSVELVGVTPKDFSSSVLQSTTFSGGDAGSLTVNTRKLLIRDGGGVSTSTLARGKAGNLFINASDSIEVSGTASGFMISVPSFLASSASIVNERIQKLYMLPPVPSGASGSLTIKTPRLSVTDGGLVNVRNDGPGNAGTVKIDANSINLDYQGGITASTASGTGGNIFLNILGQLNLDHNSIISATAGGQGTGGNITIDPQTTTISNGSGITVNSTGTGNAGQLKISSNNLTLNNDGFLSANTNGDEGGNIFLNAQNVQLRHSSLFTAAAQGSGNGGNITINTGTLAALENSPITANAYKGRGGNIQINAQGIFRSPDSRITATGTQSGRNGTVQVNTLVNNSTLGLVRLPIVPVDAAKLIAQGCGVNTGPRGNKFVVIGSGGLPPGPNEPQTGNTVWTDLGSDAAPKSVSSDSSDIENATPSTEYEYKGGPLVEAQGWVTNSKGEVVLTANPPTLTPDIPWVKPASCHAR